MKILIVQTAFLGDIVLSTPVIEAVKALYPAAEISFLTTPMGADLLKNDPRLSEVLIFDKRKADRGIRGLFRFGNFLREKNIAMVFSLHKSWRTSLLLWWAKIPVRIGFASAKLSFLYTQRKVRASGVHDVIRNLSLVDEQNPAELAESASLALFAPQTLHSPSPAADILADRYIVIAPGSAWKTKRWKSDNFRELVANISPYQKVVLVGSAEERQLCESIAAESPAINLAGRLSLNDLLLVVKNSVGVVCNDSVVLHIASSFKRPVAALFCATSPDFGFGPWQTPHRILQSQVLACRPCRSHGSNKCPTGTERCRTDVPAAAVITALRKLECYNN